MKIQERFICGKCIHYVRHYRKEKNGYSRVRCGHCIYPRVKHRLPDTKACRYFEKRDTLQDTAWMADVKTEAGALPGEHGIHPV